MSQSYASNADVSLTLTHDGQLASGVVCLEFAAMDGAHFLQLPCDLLQQHVLFDNTQIIELHVAEELDGSIASFAHHWRRVPDCRAPMRAVGVFETSDPPFVGWCLEAAKQSQPQSDSTTQSQVRAQRE